MKSTKILLLLASFIGFSSNAQSIDRAQAMRQFSNNTQNVENEMLGALRWENYLEKKLNLEKDSFRVSEKIATTYQKNELVKLYCIQVKNIRIQEINLDVTEYAPMLLASTGHVHRRDEILWQKEEVRKLVQACSTDTLDVYHSKESQMFMNYKDMFWKSIKNHELELVEYRELRKSFEKIIDIRKKLVGKTDDVEKYNLMCNDYRTSFEDLLSLLVQRSAKKKINKADPFVGLANSMDEVVLKIKNHCNQ